MIRVLLAAVALAALPLGSRAGETTVRLTVRPMPAPKPALKYQLLPELAELNPGNPAQGYLRCFAEQRSFFFSKEGAAERARYLAMPLADLPVDQLRDYGRHALRQADWSARLATPDWQMVQHVQGEGLDVQLPEVGQLSILASALRVRFRAEVAGRHFNDAVRTAKTMLALGRHLGEYPAGVANRLGLAVAHLAFDSLEEMVQQPGCPNLYWALTDLPGPLVEVRKGVQGDCTLVAAELRLIQGGVPMTEEQVEKVVARLSGAIGLAREQAGLPPRNLRTGLAERVKDADWVRAARGRLIEAGRAEDLVRKLPPVQVILLDEKRAYEVRRDEGLKLLALAPWQIDALAGGEVGERGEDGLFAELLQPHVIPHAIESRRQQGRLEQRVALLRHVEALRLYAAAHDGRLPETLAEVPVPLPPDPFTGKPFLFKAAAATACLQGSPPRGEEQNACYNVRYEVALQK
jgi:hypothetical protein